MGERRLSKVDAYKVVFKIHRLNEIDKLNNDHGERPTIQSFCGVTYYGKMHLHNKINGQYDLHLQRSGRIRFTHTILSKL